MSEKFTVSAFLAAAEHKPTPVFQRLGKLGAQIAFVQDVPRKMFSIRGKTSLYLHNLSQTLGKFMNILKALVFAILVAGALFASQADAIPANLPPPAGAILNLDGQFLPQTYFTRYSVDFTATDTVTGIMFAGRDDPGATYLDNVSVNNTNAPDVNLIQNGDFESGLAANGGNDFAPVGWAYRNPHDLTFFSVVDCYNVGTAAANCAWINQGVGAYDLISQSIGTVVGDTYQIAFYAAWIPGYPYSQETHWSQISTNGLSGTHGNGVNIAVYANAASPAASVPEPAALGMFGLGVLLIGLFAGLRVSKKITQLGACRTLVGRAANPSVRSICPPFLDPWNHHGPANRRKSVHAQPNSCLDHQSPTGS